MGKAAYERGSEAIQRAIQSDFVNSETAKQADMENLSRVFERVEELEKFSTEANCYFIEFSVDTSNRTMVASSLRARFDKKLVTKKLTTMLDECTFSHAHWVDVDRRDVVALVTACVRKARAWKVLFDYLNPPPAFQLPFNIPSNL